jgi:aarF domain-containing kinase
MAAVGAALAARLEKSRQASHDYIANKRAAEAAKQERFRALVGGDADFAVPGVVSELSTGRVLVTDWLAGVPIDALAGPEYSQATRDAVARKLLKLTLRELFTWRFVQTDPNWGNYLWDAQTRRIGLIDFGAARPYAAPFVDDYLRLVWAAANGDGATIAAVSTRLGFLTGYESAAMLEAHVASGLAPGW